MALTVNSYTISIFLLLCFIYSMKMAVISQFLSYFPFFLLFVFVVLFAAHDQRGNIECQLNNTFIIFLLKLQCILICNVKKYKYYILNY